MDTDIARILVAAVLALWGAVVACIVYIRNDKDKQIAKLEQRIEKMEAWDEQRDRASDRYVETLERAVDLLDRQTGVAETALKARRRSLPGGGDD